jgi:hypothetical protein
MKLGLVEIAQPDGHLGPVAWVALGEPGGRIVQQIADRRGVSSVDG